MSDEDYIKNKIYDDNLYNRLILKGFNNEPITDAEQEYMIFAITTKSI